MNSDLTHLRLLDDLAPLHGEFKSHIESGEAVVALETCWRIGDVLARHCDKHGIAPHALYRKLYGKSEGSENKAQLSYISREFLGRCFRIRNIFPDENSILLQLPTLAHYSAFREAMPFFDNAKAKLPKEEHEKILTMLNSNIPSSKQIIKIRAQLKIKLNKSNPRTQRLGDVESHKKSFVTFYRDVQSALTDFETHLIRDAKITSVQIKQIANSIGSLTQDGLLHTPMPDINQNLPPIWHDFIGSMSDLGERSTQIQIRRFRRLVPPRHMVKLSDMLHELAKKVGG